MPVATINKTTTTIPAGKIKCYITGAYRKDTPEEHVRQRVCRSIVEEYGYAKNDIELERVVQLGTDKKRADIVVFEEGAAHTPYMLPQEMFDFYWHPKKFVLADKMPDIKNWFLKQGWVVLTQSGSVGKPYFATDADEKVVLSQNAIRIPPKEIKQGGFLYAYLATWIGQTLLKKDEFGITVKHIRPHHVDSIPVPVIPTKTRDEISAKVEKAFKLRAEAISLLDEAKGLIYEALEAPHKPPVEEEGAEEA